MSAWRASLLSVAFRWTHKSPDFAFVLKYSPGVRLKPLGHPSQHLEATNSRRLQEALSGKHPTGTKPLATEKARA
jgi:hypothetical protein